MNVVATRADDTLQQDELYVLYGFVAPQRRNSSSAVVQDKYSKLLINFLKFMMPSKILGLRLPGP